MSRRRKAEEAEEPRADEEHDLPPTIPPRGVMSYPGPIRHQWKKSSSLTRTIQTTSSSRPPDKDPIDSHGRPDPDRVEEDEFQDPNRMKQTSC
ncbi:hypothetical protein EYF80_061938 [Liparis tanakae]|uniref:Uncharacterized protein n=1 Tax=Liparis tanakae TaxID=230148 RepID=A0A4Z2EGR4_9TELE|nr:hypothetical protein EYF80_061938 [Liparis tanakae]